MRARRPRAEPRVPCWLERAAGRAWRLVIPAALFRAIPYLLGRADSADPPGALARPG